MQIKDDMYIANLAFLLSYDDGDSTDEIEYEIFKAAFQQKESVHYDRSNGGGFQDLEQEPKNPAAFLKFGSNLVQSVYNVNAEKGFDPYIVIGFQDIMASDENNGDTYVVNVKYRLLQELSKIGEVTL